MAKPEPTKSATRSALILAGRRDMFGSSDDSDPPSLRRSRSAESEKGYGFGHWNDLDCDAIMHHSPGDRDDPGVGTSIDTSQETVDRNILRLAPEKKPWLPPQRVLSRLSDTTSDRYRIRLFYSSKLYKLDPSASNFRTEHDFFIDVFFKHRWYSGNHKRGSP